MEILHFKTNISSPIGIQAIWDSLKVLGVNKFNIDFWDVDNILKVMADQFISSEKIIEVICRLGYHCEELK
ncbi:hypothetical protein LV89_04995 [Arcicella aurantiaca]|uniref:HMA domain-containing protein n=1 Tax=Arcicella aurantiaca TaxID=591202 RepID=A0A316DCP6_9BACT|nr:hypothetical protein [Arcicella aurantiaca]PWK15057.1 hypothetical protein LV89_04995 [Arcicella aurantiaca]